jgi:hypothetical protein
LTSIPQNKQELEHAIELSFDKILADYLSIPDELSRKISVEGNIKGTEISVCDTLAYLIGWGGWFLSGIALFRLVNLLIFPKRVMHGMS